MSGCGKPASVQRGKYGTAVQARLFCWYACPNHLAHALRAPTTPDPVDRSTLFAHRTWSAGRALPGGFLHPPYQQPDLVARFCQLPLVACHESSRGKHRDRVARSGDLAVLALAPRSWEELVAVIRNQCSANPHYPWRVSHDPSPDVCLWVAIEPCPSLAPAELGCWVCRCGGIPALIFRTSTARRANDARSLWRCLPELCCADGSDCAALASLTPAPALPERPAAEQALAS